MYRNLYDTDNIIYSPEGRLYQVEYANEATKQGTCAVAIKSKEFVVVCGLKKCISKLSYHQEKLFKIDDYIGVTMSGITSDAKVLTKYMRNECLTHKFLFDENINVEKLVKKVADKYQKNTQKSSKRAFGVGLIISGYFNEPHIFETKSNGSYFEYEALSFGARSHASKTYLEKNLHLFEESSLDDLIIHCLKALKCSLSSETELTADNTSLAIVGKDKPWEEMPYVELIDYLTKVNSEKRTEDSQDNVENSGN
ncbi:proteasome subunit alpha type-1, putative [Plasmodium chabaudi chabaudi]|uniref:Proteasome subunit alpha type-1, putative n=2 Tax=Plasmodium chabaudi TaxID=5825 RepID=A0A077TQA0_PLACU|nr:proteasome subunit alpha type-1, putative [Plasmodium chabaudi chabaudi]SCM03593.1 proteasome subunit alpha type-1, putative [Plasmodium chabaudi chabaudi]SCM08983.1 proteasome subunit alpha type-1, putative [Plasmodium chabaudi adami]VTZ69996.1 proteasome subunit alpha type-1, putative [Plasmodium chabaudi chabaudi]|eukprot:XP_742981.1 proteosome subunit alpha type 1, putative [Plasmodium chabaudi chabaudi]